MYLKRIEYEDGYHYVLRATYRENGLWKYRDLIDLGKNPEEYIVYPGGNSFYIRPEIEDDLSSRGIEYRCEDLEEVFMPFLHPGIRYIMERFKRVHSPYPLSKACALDELPKYQEELHPFDIRRLHYLKFGHVDMGSIETDTSWRFLKVLSCKCRDEIEATFDEMEKELPRRETSSYIYTALHLQKYFHHHILRDYPVGLHLEEIDQHFIEEICRLNHDEDFFRGSESSGNGALHPYIAKYVWLYFDHAFEPDSPWEGFVRDFERRRQYHGRMPSASPRPAVSIQEAYAIFGISQEKFAAMKKKDLLRLYRRKAKRVHPDKGGDHDAFVRLTEAYELLRAA